MTTVEVRQIPPPPPSDKPSSVAKKLRAVQPVVTTSSQYKFSSVTDITLIVRTLSSKYRAFFSLVQRSAEPSANVASAAACWGSLTSDYGNHTNDSNDVNL
jgi:hypothetical protein